MTPVCDWFVWHDSFKLSPTVHVCYDSSIHYSVTRATWVIHVCTIHVWVIHVWVIHVWVIHVWVIHVWVIHVWVIHVCAMTPHPCTSTLLCFGPDPDRADFGHDLRVKIFSNHVQKLRCMERTSVHINPVMFWPLNYVQSGHNLCHQILNATGFMCR